ncbi:hypothetical protein M3Y97_00677500 [Aphelenchoides bicaudatus]|nr:hypothetical protein M3Y97_00677500 [Aphelenchoides bicaudatus]
MTQDVERAKIVQSKRPRTHWASIYVASGLSFVGSVQFSLYFAALWPYIKMLDSDITEDFYGLTVAVYSLGQVISAPAFGAWSNMVKQVRSPLTAGMLMMLVGNIIYLFMEGIPIPRRYILLVCRFITGMGSGNIALITYICVNSQSQCRSGPEQLHLPAFQYAFTPFKYPGWAIFGSFHLNLYTMPAYLACTINVLGIIALYTLFVEKYDGIVEEPPSSSASTVEKGQRRASRMSLRKLPMYDIIAVLVCYATRFVDMFVRSQLETLGSPFSMMMFGLKDHEAVRYVSLAQGIVGFITLTVYLIVIFGNLEEYINFRMGCIVSLLMMFLFHLTTYAWPVWDKQCSNVYNSTSIEQKVGCDTSIFTWCNNLPAINVWFYYFAYVVFIGISFPLLTITLNVLFSRILGPRRQGTQQGFFQASSALARMIGPLAASYLYSAKGPKPVWIMEMAIIGAVLASWFLFYSRLVALRMPQSIRKLSISVSRRLSRTKI